MRAIYPFTAIVGQIAMRTALIAAAVDPTIGGVLIRGQKGTGKSTAVRGLARLLPALEVVDGCPFHCPPDQSDWMHSDCLVRHERGETLPRATRPMRLVELPLNATEDRVVGTLHVEEALRTGQRKFEPGLLAAANRGVLYVDEVNLLADHLVDLLLDAAASGFNVVEREGISHTHPSRFILVGTMNPEEGELRPQFLDRFGLCVSASSLENISEREEVVRRRLGFEARPKAFVAGWAEAEQATSERIVAAQNRLASVELPDSAIHAAARLATEVGAHGHRPDLVTIKTARVLAALLDEPRVEPRHLAEAATFALPHRVPDVSMSHPDAVQTRVDDAVRRVLGGSVGEERLAGVNEESDDDAYFEEAIQVPGAAAAGSILLSFEKKNGMTSSSTPTSS